ncbi:MAG: glycosyltransferase family 2 protein [SAR324 cluster bacterium]|nr:glycosyltransferase family 2 protein [SAR324 cluster bacterium]
MTSSQVPNELSVIIPVYREALAVVQKTLKEVEEILSETDWRFEIIIVNDGSGEGFDYHSLQTKNYVSLLEHPHNKGYGAAIKTGIQHSTYPWIGITDADGTYPNQDFPQLLVKAKDADMVIGIRKLSDVPLLRQAPKFLLNRYASFLANETIADLNSGMRIFKRDLAMRFWSLYPDGFSLTSTITMAAISHGYTLAEVPIEYYKREGKSSIRPIADTYRFFKLVGRLGLYFNPLRIFIPIAAGCMGVGLLKAVRDYIVVAQVGNVSISLILAGLQIYLMGLLAELISKRS